MTDGADRAGSRRLTPDALGGTLLSELDSREATAFVHVGPVCDPDLAYCRIADSGFEADGSTAETRQTAIAFDGERWDRESATSSSHPAKRLAETLADRFADGTILTPARIPHDAALFLENRGFALASTDVVARARATKTPSERERIVSAQRAAGDGIRRAAAILADAVVEDGRLLVDGTATTVDRLRREIDEAIVAAGAFPAGNTSVDVGSTDTTDRRSNEPTAARSDEPTTVRPGEPIVVSVAPRGPTGYHGGVVRTFVVASEGGRERRAHVAVTQALRSSRAMLTADSASVTAVEADLEAEIRAFGEDGAIETRVSGVGLEPRERPSAGDETVDVGSVVRLDAAAQLADGAWVRVADLLAKTENGVDYLAAPSRSLEPRNVFE
ncbi:M24 family metallopeptidase [Natrialba swarupiae]|uniref:M24 family metallopeptidase n=1 Tax=Natrialba swarupiae TaxID=2448032 RepID=A0A5D5APH1_9EURY|nr:M24 family metallopeptidase [Natrialba swarupiae]TYT62775.1 M24 family metallopeptidase [Natrialba swarupiae]